jgi:hypothetical protein
MMKGRRFSNTFPLNLALRTNTTTYYLRRCSTECLSPSHCNLTPHSAKCITTDCKINLDIIKKIIVNLVSVAGGEQIQFRLVIAFGTGLIHTSFPFRKHSVSTKLNLGCLHPVARVRSDDVGFNASTQRTRNYRRLIYYLYIHSYMFRSYDHRQAENILLP